ncbi:PTS sugar transporter subunit IIA [Desulfothermus okinawensis JCM 13304]
MQLSEFLSKDLILPELKSTTKQEVLKELVKPLEGKFPGLNIKNAYKVLIEREQLGSTGIGDGVAIPHGKLHELNKIIVVVGRSFLGVDFDALDKKPCHIFFLVLAPENVAGLHLRILAHISRLLKDPEFRQSFMEAEGVEGIWDLLTSG